MTGSPSSVISLGLGSWGSPGLMVTLGFGQGEAAVVTLTARKLHHLTSPNPQWHVLTNQNPTWHVLLSQPDFHVIELPE